jgi:Tfp pilus assembly protein PilF
VWQYANFLQTIESFDEAQQFYQRTIAADPNNADALNNLVCEPRFSPQCERKG